MKHNLPGQLDMPIPEGQGADSKRPAILAPLRPTVAQQPMDIGIFSDDRLQIDLIDTLRK